MTVTQGTVVERISGDSRVATAVAASRSTFANGATQVVLACAEAFADALSAVPLTARLAAPFLLVDRRTQGAVEEEIRRLGAQHAVLIGGYGVLPVVVELELQQAGLTVERFAGDGRYHTAARVARRLGPGSQDDAVLASGETFADALPAGPFAAITATPVLLTAPGSLPPDTDAILRAMDVRATWVVGGQAAVHDEVMAVLPGAQRISGPDRYSTSVAVARAMLDHGGALQTVALASGHEFADALVAAALAAHHRGPLLLVDGQDAMSADVVYAFLREQRGQIGRAVLVGDTQALHADVERRIKESLQ